MNPASPKPNQLHRRPRASLPALASFIRITRWVLTRCHTMRQAPWLRFFKSRVRPPPGQHDASMELRSVMRFHQKESQMPRLLSIALLISLITGLEPAMAQAPTAPARPARPTPPTRDPNTPGY